MVGFRPVGSRFESPKLESLCHDDGFLKVLQIIPEPKWLANYWSNSFTNKNRLLIMPRPGLKEFKHMLTALKNGSFNEKKL